MRMPLVWIERQLAAVIRPAHRTVGAKGKGPPESPPTALFGFGSPGRTRTSDQSVTPVPPFPTGVDYLIAVGRTACRRRALVGRLFFRHSLVSAPSLRPADAPRPRPPAPALSRSAPPSPLGARPVLGRFAPCALPMPPDPVALLERSRARPPPLIWGPVQCSGASRPARFRCPQTP